MGFISICTYQTVHLTDYNPSHYILYINLYIKYSYNPTVCFIDCSKAFDTVKPTLWVDLLQLLNVDQAELRLLTSLYWNKTAAVRCDDDISEWMSIKHGVRQGCVASPHLFALYT